MESLEELKTIIMGKPEGATHYSVPEQAYYKFKCECWMWCCKGSFLFQFVQDDDEVCDDLSSLSDIKQIIELMEINKALMDKINQFDKAITDIGKHIQKSEPSFCMGGVDVGDSQSKIIGYIKELEAALYCYNKE